MIILINRPHSISANHAENCTKEVEFYPHFLTTRYPTKTVQKKKNGTKLDQLIVRHSSGFL